jgi:hypothetical protein
VDVAEQAHIYLTMTATERARFDANAARAQRVADQLAVNAHHHRIRVGLTIAAIAAVLYLAAVAYWIFAS